MNHRYYALAATCALFKHAEFKLNNRFAAASLRIRYVPVEGTMMIDPDTARNLELVGNMACKKSVHSLFGCVRTSGRFINAMPIVGPRVLNHTYTAMAARLLRVNILSPITGKQSFTYLSVLTCYGIVQPSIDARLDVVEGEASHYYLLLFRLL